jgi:hypothetical protein
VQIRNHRFLAAVNKIKKKKNEIDSPASGGGQGKYVKYVSFPWPPLEAVLSVFNVGFFFVNEKIL